MEKSGAAPTPVKITFPRLGRFVPRTRLFDQIDAARHRRIVWISAPPGAGKTTLAATYLAERGFQSIWYQMDEGDADIASFFYYMGLAAQNISADREAPLPLFTPEYALGLPVFARRYFEQLYGQMEQPYVFLFDNYQTVPADSHLHEAICVGLEQMPEGGNAIIVSREDPPPAFARLRANQNIELIDWESLRLDDTEFSEILRLQGWSSPDSDELKRLRLRTGGWMAGLMLLLEASRSNVPAETSGKQLLGDQSPQVVFDYFATEILERQDPATQEFLLQISLLPRLTEDMASRLTGFPESGKILEQLYLNQHFIERHNYGDTLYQLHPLFREFLLARTRHKYSPVDYVRLQHRAATVLERAGQIEAAVSLFLSANDWAESSRLICLHAMDFLQQGRGETVIRWIQRIPQAVMEDMPWLRFWLGTAQIGVAPLEARVPLEQAYRAFSDAGDLPGMCMALAKLVETFSYGWHDMFPLDKWIAELEAVLAKHPDLPSPEIAGQVTVAMFVALMHRRPNHPDMKVWTQRTRDIVRHIQSPNDRVIIGMQLATYFVWWGKHRDMELLLEELRPLMGSSDISAVGYIAFHAIEAMYYTRSLSGDGVAAALAGLERAEQSGVYVMNPLLLGFAALSSMNAGNLKDAAGYLGQSSILFHPARLMDQAFYHWNRGHLAWLQGDMDGACEQARQCVAIATQFGSTFHNLMTPISLTKILVETGEYREAAEIIEKLLPEIRKVENPSLEYECMLVVAKSAFTQGDDKAGLEALRHALTVMKESDAESTIWWNPRWIVPLLAQALDVDIEVEYVQWLIRKHKLIPETQHPGLEKWPWPIKIHTFGGLTLVLDGEPARSGGKGQKKPVDLLKALVAFGGLNVSEILVMDALWPDAEGDDARNSLKTTLHRLRKLLGNEKAIQVGGGKLSLNPGCCWTDVWEFERLVGPHAASETNDIDKAKRLERAVKLYNGPFLNADGEESWLLAPRERLRSRYLLAVEALGMCWEKSDLWEKAIECYERGIRADDLAEPFYQRLMACHAELGRRGEALATYERYCKVLATRFGVDPPEALQALALQLQS